MIAIQASDPKTRAGMEPGHHVTWLIHQAGGPKSQMPLLKGSQAESCKRLHPSKRQPPKPDRASATPRYGQGPQTQDLMDLGPTPTWRGTHRAHRGPEPCKARIPQESTSTHPLGHTCGHYVEGVIGHWGPTTSARAPGRHHRGPWPKPPKAGQHPRHGRSRRRPGSNS